MNRMNLKNAVWEMWKNPIFHYLPVDVFRSSDWGSFFIDVLEVKRSLSVGSNLHSCTYPPQEKFNVEPENDGFQKESPFPRYFQVLC